MARDPLDELRTEIRKLLEWTDGSPVRLSADEIHRRAIRLDELAAEIAGGERTAFAGWRIECENGCGKPRIWSRPPTDEHIESVEITASGKRCGRCREKMSVSRIYAAPQRSLLDRLLGGRI
ncbi:hypothetical protein FKB34_01705 [Glycocaulis profundi]|nr:hypothetical protein FKB34_01705 [Glycocaulis profundi]